MAPVPIAYEYEFSSPGPIRLANIINENASLREYGIIAVPWQNGLYEEGGENLAELIEYHTGLNVGAHLDGSSREEARDFLLNSPKIDGVPSIWLTKTDGTRGVESELISPILAAGRAGDVENRLILAAISAAGAQVNTVCCGLHIHFGAISEHGHLKALRRPGQTQTAALYGVPLKRAQITLAEMYAYFQPVIDSILPRSRRGSRRICGGCELPEAGNWWLGEKGENNAGKSAFIHNPRQPAGGSGGSEGRYYKINFAALDLHGTVEFRQHQGTLNPTKAIMWGRVCAAFWARAVNPAYNHLDCRQFSVNVGGLCSFLGLGQKTHRYLLGRARRFDFPRIARGAYDKSRGRQVRSARRRESLRPSRSGTTPRER